MTYTQELEKQNAELQERLAEAETIIEQQKTPYLNLCKQLQKDPDYTWTFHCNVAMSLIDGKFIKNRKQANLAAYGIMYDIFKVGETYKKKYEKEFV
jgi:hypothetical protein